MKPFRRKQTKGKQNSATVMISADGKGTVFPVKLRLQGNSLNKEIKKENFKKDVMNLIEINQ